MPGGNRNRRGTRTKIIHRSAALPALTSSVHRTDEDVAMPETNKRKPEEGEGDAAKDEEGEAVSPSKRARTDGRGGADGAAESDSVAALIEAPSPSISDAEDDGGPAEAASSALAAGSAVSEDEM